MAPTQLVSSKRASTEAPSSRPMGVGTSLKNGSGTGPRSLVVVSNELHTGLHAVAIVGPAARRWIAFDHIEPAADAEDGFVGINEIHVHTAAGVEHDDILRIETEVLLRGLLETAAEEFVGGDRLEFVFWLGAAKGLRRLDAVGAKDDGALAGHQFGWVSRLVLEISGPRRKRAMG